MVLKITLKWSGEGVQMLFHYSEGVPFVIGPYLKDYLGVLVDDILLGLKDNRDGTYGITPHLTGYHMGRQ